jgi:cytochrome P450/NADPH-cytochrome P450 reductase
MRGCIGRPFAWQEAILTTAMLLQNFNFRFDDPSYQLQIKQTLTIKPKDFFMHATLRDHVDPVYLEKSLHGDALNAGKVTEKGKIKSSLSTGKAKKPMTVLYGSNSGTCEALAQSLARVASGRGFRAQVEPLDSAVGKVPKDQPVVLISSSYEGQPPDNAAHFFEWLQNLEGGNQLEGVKYATYGCGNRKLELNRGSRGHTNCLQMTGFPHSTEFRSFSTRDSRATVHQRSPILALEM